ncbi:hypothetical protein ABFT23_19910 [Nocardioides sp. C4-1]|uniref:hypothetical protein n=1 Tax=Nocardioides sp. C4-1 TaxID=3151851 RepID=UPI003263A466
MTDHHAATDDVATRRAISMARFTAGVTHLLDERHDLHGVHPMADLVYDSVRWSA